MKKQGADLLGADLREADLEGADLMWVDLREADLEGANLLRANLRGADLRDADLLWGNLRDADLRCANLEGANLRDADLRCANLEGANLRDADLRCANLEGANLRDADLRCANLEGAKLFKIGISYITPGAQAAVDKQEQETTIPEEWALANLLLSHQRGDWGDVCSEDTHVNNEAVQHGGRIVSKYTLEDKNATEIWVITETDRNTTTILLPEEERK